MVVSHLLRRFDGQFVRVLCLFYIATICCFVVLVLVNVVDIDILQLSFLRENWHKFELDAARKSGILAEFVDLSRWLGAADGPLPLHLSGADLGSWMDHLLTQAD